MAGKRVRNRLLHFNEVEFHFIYNFLFSPDGFDELNNILEPGVPEERMGWIPTNIGPGFFENNRHLWFDPILQCPVKSIRGAQKSRVVVRWFPEAKLRSKLGLRKTDERIQEFRADLSTLLRLSRNGIGVVTLTVSASAEQNPRRFIRYFDTQAFLRLTPRTWHQVLTNRMVGSSSEEDQPAEETDTDEPFLSKIVKRGDNGETEYSLFELFQRTVDWLHSSKHRNGEGAADERTAVIHPMKSHLVDDKSNYFFGFGLMEKNALSEYLRERKIVPQLKDTVHPYLYISGELPNSQYRESFLECEGRTDESSRTARNWKYSKQIAALLFRFFDLTKYKYLSTAYMRRELQMTEDPEPSITSDNINTLLFSHIYRMGAISLYSKASIKEKIPYEIIRPSLIDMLEHGRSRSYGLMMANLLLDEIIYSIQSTEKLDIEVLQDYWKPLLAAERMVALTSANPSISLHDGHVAFDIIEIVDEKLGVGRLSCVVQGKVALVRDFLKSVESIEIQEKHKSISKELKEILEEEEPGI